MHTTRFSTVCPWCHAHAHAHAAPTASPIDGDGSLCWQCGEVSIFEGRALRKPTPFESAALAKDARVAVARDALKAGSTVADAVARMKGVS